MAGRFGLLDVDLGDSFCGEFATRGLAGLRTSDIGSVSGADF